MHTYLRCLPAPIGLALVLVLIVGMTSAGACDTLDCFQNPPNAHWAVFEGPHSSAFAIDLAAAGKLVVAGSQWDADAQPGSGFPPWGLDNTAVLLELEANGAESFHNTIRAPSDPDDDTVAFDVKYVPDGGTPDGYILTGLKWRHHIGDRDIDWYQRDLWLLRTDASGDFAWDQTYGGLGDHWGNSIALDWLATPGPFGVVIGGRQNNLGATVDYGGWLLRTDTGGTTTLNVGYSTVPFEPEFGWLSDVINAIDPLPDGGHIAATERGVVRSDATGAMQWRSNTDIYHAVEALTNLGTVTGYIATGLRDTDPTGAANWDLLVTRLAPDGTVLWEHTFGGQGYECGRQIQAPDNYDPDSPPPEELYKVLGVTASIGNGGTDIWLLGTNDSGDLLWQMTFGGPENDYGYDFVDGGDPAGTVIAGRGSLAGETYLWVINAGEAPAKPQAAFTYSPPSPVFQDQVVAFDGSLSYDPDGTLTTYDWDFGDGNQASGETLPHAFAEPGTYTVTLIVEDADGVPSDPVSRDITVIAHNLLWETEIGGGGNDYAFDIIPAHDGGYVVTGYSDTYPSHAGSWDAWLFKTDLRGVLQWQRRFNDATGNPALNEVGNAICITPEGGYMIAGTVGGGSLNTDMWLIRTLVDGTGAGMAKHGGANRDEGRAISPVGGGGYIIGGTTSAALGNQDAWLVKVHANGALDWQQVFDQEGDPDAFNAVDDVGGGYLLGGDYGPTGDGPLFVYLTDGGGTPDWRTTWTDPSPRQNFGDWTAPALGGGYLVAGGYEEDLTLRKVLADGTEDWVQDFNGGGVGARGYAAARTLDGGYIIAGTTIVNGSIDNDVYVVKTDAAGNLVWERTFGLTTHYETAYGILALADGGYVVLANRTRFSPSSGKGQVWLFAFGPSWPLPSADFTATPATMGPAPLTVDFTDTSSGGTPPYTHSWDLDHDGTADSSDPNPSRTYAAPGLYTTSLQIIDDQGMTDTAVKNDYIVATGIRAMTAGVTITASSVTSFILGDPEAYDPTGAPPGVDLGSALGFTLTATGPDGAHAFRITFDTPVDPAMVLYKLPAWDALPYTLIDEYTVEVILEISSGVLDPPFALARLFLTNPGDVLRDGRVDLKDAILTLEIIAGITRAYPNMSLADVNGDNQIGLEESLYILQRLAGSRP